VAKVNPSFHTSESQFRIKFICKIEETTIE
jgi:hypothetical protein